ncbi:RecF/RecN/SMC N terminal domain-containing protein [Haematococcus lacustris]
MSQIELSGFKSYKDAAPSEPFSPRINVVVGANGSGKSNFFHAIRFVLNDAFVNMGVQQEGGPGQGRHQHQPPAAARAC